MNAPICLLITLLLAAVAVIHLASMSPAQRQALTIRTMHRRGHSQRAIAAALGITRYRVRSALA